MRILWNFVVFGGITCIKTWYEQIPIEQNKINEKKMMFRATANQPIEQTIEL